MAVRDEGGGAQPLIQAKKVGLRFLINLPSLQDLEGLFYKNNAYICTGALNI
jgi:hypothetical protein